MKKIFIFIFCLSLFFLSGCSKKETNNQEAQNQAYLSSVDKIISNEISSFDNSESFDEETIKTLSVILRTNFENNLSNKKELTKNNNDILNNDIYNIVRETSGEVLEDEEEPLTELYIEDDKTKNQEWCVLVKKSKILEMLKKNNISLSNLSNFEVVTNEEGYTEKIIIAGKEFDFYYLMKAFNLPSNKNISIVNNLTSIKITGIGIGKNENFNLETIKTLSNQGYDYKSIIKSKKNSFKIINNA
ncbi:MAG: hypothetical protein IJA23_02840 [Clostridia bacterium]|nr:hypothetical protein [Clostridia bacterium]